MEREELTLRDKLALSAPEDLIEFETIEDAAEFVGIEITGKETLMEMAHLALRVVAEIQYRYADAMLAARSR